MNFVAFLSQAVDGLPYGGPGNGQLFRDFFSGKIDAFIFFKESEELFLCFHLISAFLPDDPGRSV